jgi:hypothetical protein
MDDTDNPNDAAANTGDNPSPPTPVKTLNKSVLDKNKAKPTEEYISETKQLINRTRTIEWWQFALTALVDVVGIIAICIYYGQLQVMKGQLGEIVKQFPEIHEQRIATQGQLTQARIDSAVAGAATANQLAAMQAQLEVMRDADRPWVDVDILIASPLTYDGKAARIDFTFVVSDIGRSPAQNVSIIGMLTPAFFWDDLRQTQKRVCNDAATPIGMGSFRYVLFPGRPITQQTSIAISGNNLDSHIGKLPQGAGPVDLMPIALVGCVDYTYESSARHHQTAFTVDLLMKDRGLPLRSKTPIPSSDLMLSSHPISSHYPN